MDDTLEILGYRLGKKSFKRKGSWAPIFYRVKKVLSKSHQVFMHIEKPGTSHRILGDHYVMNHSPDGSQKKCVGYYENKHWMKGDIIVDAYERNSVVYSFRASGNVDGFLQSEVEETIKGEDFDKEMFATTGRIGS